MESDELLYEMRGPDGRVWRVYLDGRVEGFPPGTVVCNYALSAHARMVGEMEKQSVCLPAQ